MAGWTSDVSIAAGGSPVASRAVKTGPACLSGAYVANYSTSPRYLQFFNSATSPSGGDAPALQYVVLRGAAGYPATFFADGSWFSNPTFTSPLFTDGLAWGISTTAGTFTAAEATDCDVEVHFA